MAQPTRHFEGSVRVGVAPEQIWPLVADTARLNRAVGLPPVVYQVRRLPDGAAETVAAYQVGPLTIARWIEAPFQWQAPRGYFVERSYLDGPLLHFRGGAALAPLDGGTVVRFWAAFTPRNRFGLFLVDRVVGQRSIDDSLAQVKIFEQYLRGEVDDPFPRLRVTTPLARVQRLFRSNSTLSQVPPPAGPATALSAARIQPRAAEAEGAWLVLAREGAGAESLVAKLRQHLETAADTELAKMRPFELADRWGEDRQAVLVLCLRATTAGVLDLTWEVLCPHCRVSKHSFDSLSGLSHEGFCDACNTSFEAQFDRNVEVRFTVSPLIRQVDTTTTFCFGGPMNTPHLVARAIVEPGAEATLELVTEPRAYVLTAPGVGSSIVLRAVAAPGTVGSSPRVEVRREGLSPNQLALEVGPVRLRLVNRLPTAALLDLEKPEWPETAATAALVSTLSEFRDLFSSEVLAPGVQVAIQRLAFIFTDLAGSTALYQTAGQATAFRIVQEHFQVLFAAVRANRGTVVKTIGDAVMATFPSAAAAFEAALAIQRDVRSLDTRGAADPARLVKVGVHLGPCVAATANERLDYFGTTVNVAARVEGVCRGGELALSDAVAEDPLVRQRLETGGFVLEQDTVLLRGIREPVRVTRVLNPAQTTAAQPATPEPAAVPV